MIRLSQRLRCGGPRASRITVAAVTVAMVLGSCGSPPADTGSAATIRPLTTSSPSASAETSDDCAHVVAVDVTGDAAGYTFAVTVVSSETGWDKYADAWIVTGRDGTIYGERVLAHPHVDEQPFTRSLTGVSIPEGVTEVVVAARDSVLGFCGETMTVAVEGAG